MTDIECITRAVIQNEDKLLVCRGKGKSNWFFPGGHIEKGESAPQALLRELEEELGATGEVIRFLGASENTFIMNGKKIQEINLVFEVALDEHAMIESKEAHLEFEWFTLDELQELNVFPLSLRDAILSGVQQKTLIWASEGFE
ncbi:MAG: NUDIX domain-containing protein [Patescibacteria group bacterium]